ncbi:hypothetical protein C7M84_021285 [Penaeus vannamei]|uniref:Transmembrane protein n=1 Tax=Penaeus vannamei TaxID=6689 RepID=A0A3R7Q9Q4_PENVA|nr:hypothetical protein C7M84_021285 [Penaeus vannamei]
MSLLSLPFSLSVISLSLVSSLLPPSFLSPLLSFLLAARPVPMFSSCRRCQYFPRPATRRREPLSLSSDSLLVIFSLVLLVLASSIRDALSQPLVFPYCSSLLSSFSLPSLISTLHYPVAFIPSFSFLSLSFLLLSSRPLASLLPSPLSLSLFISFLLPISPLFSPSLSLSLGEHLIQEFPAPKARAASPPATLSLECLGDISSREEQDLPSAAGEDAHKRESPAAPTQPKHRREMSLPKGSLAYYFRPCDPTKGVSIPPNERPWHFLALYSFVTRLSATRRPRFETGRGKCGKICDPKNAPNVYKGESGAKSVIGNSASAESETKGHGAAGDRIGQGGRLANRSRETAAKILLLFLFLLLVHITPLQYLLFLLPPLSSAPISSLLNSPITYSIVLLHAPSTIHPSSLPASYFIHSSYLLPPLTSPPISFSYYFLFTLLEHIFLFLFHYSSH